MSAAAETLAALRTAVARIEADGRQDACERIGFGVETIDLALGGGLRRGAVHAVSGAAAAATGFAVALAAKAAETGGAVLWIRQDMGAREGGEPWPMGIAELGLDPGRLVMLRAADEAATFRAAEAGLACRGLAAALIEPFGRMAGFGRTAGRRLALAAGRSGATGLLLRAGAAPIPPGFSAAETRWRVASAVSDEAEEAWGRPRFSAELVRNRRGGVGRWTLEWRGDERGFELVGRAGDRAGAAERAPDHGDRAAAPGDRAGEAARAGVVAFRRAG